jgi:hypothetical protein
MKWLQLHKVIVEQNHPLEIALPGLYTRLSKIVHVDFFCCEGKTTTPNIRAPVWWLSLDHPFDERKPSNITNQDDRFSVKLGMIVHHRRHGPCVPDDPV